MSTPLSPTDPAHQAVWEVRALDSHTVVAQTPDLQRAGQAVATLAEAGQPAAIYPTGRAIQGLAGTETNLQVVRACDLTPAHTERRLWLFSPAGDVLSGHLLWTCPLSGHAGHVSMVLLGVHLYLGYGLSHEVEVPVNLDFPVVIA